MAGTRSGQGRPRAVVGRLAVLAAGLVLGVVGCGGDGGGTATSPAVTTVTTTAAAVDRSPGVFFVAGEQFVEGTRDGLDSSSDLRSLVEALLEGPTAAESGRDYWSDIPQGTSLTSAKLSADGATAELAFDARFDEDAGSAAATRRDSLYLRLGQVVFTATSLPGVREAVISVPGVEDLRLARADFTEPARREKPSPAVDAAAEIATEAPAEPVSKPQQVQKPPPPKPTAAALGTAEVQRRLIELGYLPSGSDDGKAGERTRHAVIAFQGWEGLGRDGVVGPQTSARLKAAARPVPRSGGSGRRVEIHRAKGVLLLIEGGRVVRALHTATGTGGDSPETGTPPGSFRIYRKEERSWSVPFKTWLPWAAYWNAGWAMHEYPDVPAWPASHGCARLPAGEARLAYEFVSIGTPVTVY